MKRGQWQKCNKQYSPLYLNSIEVVNSNRVNNPNEMKLNLTSELYNTRKQLFRHRKERISPSVISGIKVIIPNWK